ncbi:uncharacterized protein Z519_11457 [Cladophialophora bantiana CBS 173.52]|uniref:Uncharacterized protein n=1 Tax=Cladophialophora bantiana (strain ATCC 10958 / CBS 173.52 / CDC B-1940 / NIH 8579) TaxID=1442370 RepID=A0A0D2H3I5_CLAB1|nr:uncharacterized protein Z519_11457 [Cladophialophora bantiana CBS 173.52]KIW87873.1 hypothetical protein Z519_11457 [Cladophialophora bantiana CBS 173.52]
MAVSASRIIIGLNYGTTYSSVSLATVAHNQHDINLNNDDEDVIGLGGIRDVLSWPGLAGTAAPKAPSVISYDTAEDKDRPHELDLGLKVLDVMADLDLICHLGCSHKPQEWTDSAISMTFRAITASGFSKNYFPRFNNIILVSEPEAAALFVIKSIQQVGDRLSLRVSFLVFKTEEGADA